LRPPALLLANMAMQREEIERLAQLARLELTAEEGERLPAQLDAILGFVGRLARIDTSGVPEEGDTESDPSWRVDEAASTDEATRAQIIQNFPDRRGDALRVPAIFERPKG